jgi:hypothetical protein
MPTLINKLIIGLSLGYLVLGFTLAALGQPPLPSLDAKRLQTIISIELFVMGFGIVMVWAMIAAVAIIQKSRLVAFIAFFGTLFFLVSFMYDKYKLEGCITLALLLYYTYGGSYILPWNTPNEKELLTAGCNYVILWLTLAVLMPVFFGSGGSIKDFGDRQVDYWMGTCWFAVVCLINIIDYTSWFYKEGILLGLQGKQINERTEAGFQQRSEMRKKLFGKTKMGP